MAEIRKGISSELDILNIIKYADPKFDWEQMNIIRKDLEKEKIETQKKIKQEIKKYEEMGFSWEQIREIRYGLEEGLNVSKYADPKFSAEQMQVIRKKLEAEKTTKKEPKMEI